jgi:hypothetical protein
MSLRAELRLGLLVIFDGDPWLELIPKRYCEDGVPIFIGSGSAMSRASLAYANSTAIIDLTQGVPTAQWRTANIPSKEQYHHCVLLAGP